jgi:hypothetical protein
MDRVMQRAGIGLAVTVLWLGVQAAGADTARAQQQQPVAVTAADWDSPRAQELMALARARWLLPQQDTTLRNYRAKAEGFVYFYLDRRETGERTLVKVDQVALEVLWAPPNRTRQHIVGLRDVSRLPNRMHYHLDHLTVVQDGFGDVIQMGDGDEVRDVPHPAAPGSDSIYQFRLTDSLTLRLPGAPEPIRVYEIQVRPYRLDRSALVGSVFVDRARGDIVRMTFTFTPASYVDHRLDYITVSLDNGLWDGRYWLPHEQTLQIRRQVPELDFGAGAVIHGRMRIGDYEFNDELLTERAFYGYPVTAAPHGERERFAFERGILDDLNEAGLAPPADLAAVRRQAAALLGTDRLSGLPRWRLSLGSASSALRYNRAEGVALGLGVAYVPGPTWRADVHLGYAAGPDRPWGYARLRRAVGDGGDIGVRLDYRELRDIGIAPGVPPAINTLAAAFLGRDYLDPYFATGATVELRQPLGTGWRGSIGVSAQRHHSAGLTQAAAPFSDSARFRTVLPIDDGDVASVSLGLYRPMPDPVAAAWGGGLRIEAGAYDGGIFLRPTGRAELLRASRDQRRSLRVSAAAGAVSAAAPAQQLFLLGGQGTVPGYEFRAYSGTRFGMARAEAGAAVLQPWLSLRLIAAAGATGGLRAPEAIARTGAGTPAAWQTRPTDGLRTSVGGGVSLLWDMLSIDAVRGLNGGTWQVLLSFHRDFWDIS